MMAVIKNMLPHRRLIYHFLCKNKRLAGAYIGMALISGLLKIVLLLLLGHGYEILSYSRSARSQMLENFVGIKLPDGYAFIVFYVGLALLFAITLWAEKYLATKLGERFAADVRAWVFERQLLIPAVQFEKNGFGRHLTRYGSDLTG